MDLSTRKNNQKNFLIISYLYYPSKKIGAQRWTKIGKSLKNKNINLFVLSTNCGLELNDQHFFFKTSYPAKVLKSNPVTFFQKIKYNFWIKILPLFTHFNFYDVAVFDKKTILKKANKIIQQNNIDVVIASGAPFSICYYTALLKNNYDNLKVINDFRDPWTWNNRYGYNLLSAPKKIKENDAEKYVIENSDYITTPVEPMCTYLRSKYPNHSKKIKILPHFFDFDSMSKIKKKLKKSNTLSFIYGGTIYDGTLDWYETFAKTVVNNIKDVSFNLYSQSLSSDSNSQSGLLNFRKGIKEENLLQKIENSSFYLACYPEIEKDFVSTKFYQIIFLKTPIILIAPRGELSKFIIKHDIGIHILPDEIHTFKLNMMKRDFSFNIQIQNYSLDKITDYLLSL